MIAIVIAAHGNIAQALLKAASAVVPSATRACAVSIDATLPGHTLIEKLQCAVREGRANNHGVLLLTDMLGGTPSNLGMTLHQSKKVEMVTGVNLGMLVKAMQLTLENIDLEDAAPLVKAAGFRSISIASEVLSVVGAPAATHPVVPS